MENLLRNQALREELSGPVARIPRPPTVVVPPSAEIREALQLMTDRNVASAVVASHDVLLGVLSERDLLRRLLATPAVEPQTPVWKVMSVKPDTLLEGDTVAYALRKLGTLGARAMPVVRSDGAMSGLLDSQDIIAWLCDRVSDPEAPRKQLRSHG